jgi:deoxyribonuclease-4
MPLLGAHMSIAGGHHHAVEAALKYNCETVQLFTKNSNQWKTKILCQEDVRTFRSALRDSKLQWPMAHDSYLINLASPDDVLYRRSIDALTIEVERAEQLGLSYLIMHPGSPLDSGEEAGLTRIAAGLDDVHHRCSGYSVQILLEGTAGQGSCLGHRFEHLASILERVKTPERLGICLDTCHVFAAGYPLAPATEYEGTMQQFDDIVGLEWIRAFHLNDSQKPLGSRVDRHAHIGKGCLGLEPFRLLLNDRRFRNHPIVLETPKEAGKRQDMDRRNLRVLRGLIDSVKARSCR